MTIQTGTRLFISCVTDEFGSYRRTLCEQIERPGVQVEIQDKFLPYGDRTLLMLDAYVADCAAVIHLTGDRTGKADGSSIASPRTHRSPPSPPSTPLPEAAAGCGTAKGTV